MGAGRCKRNGDGVGHTQGQGSGVPFPSKGSDSTLWNVQQPPETLPFPWMPGTQAILPLVWGLILASFVMESQISWNMGLTFQQTNPICNIVYSILSRTGPIQQQSRRLFLEMVSITVQDTVHFQGVSLYCPSIALELPTVGTGI